MKSTKNAPVGQKSRGNKVEREIENAAKESAGLTLLAPERFCPVVLFWARRRFPDLKFVATAATGGRVNFLSAV